MKIIEMYRNALPVNLKCFSDLPPLFFRLSLLMDLYAGLDEMGRYWRHCRMVWQHGHPHANPQRVHGSLYRNGSRDSAPSGACNTHYFNPVDGNYGSGHRNGSFG